ncbi:MAG: MFS transporter [Alphaproteobacteria bacterium]|nr:MFS transporter [Alphaproteobacteria bacterium]
MDTAPQASAAAPAFIDKGFRRHRRYTLFMLTLVFMFSHIDRSIVGILAEPIKAEFALSDTQLGVLTGFAFALVYATLGIPLALLADRSNRRNIITAAITVWSAMTALSGFATNYTQLVLARIGVGVGEAGSTPQSHSMIADLYPQHERARALAIYSLGVTLGVTFGFLAGGVVSSLWGWRAAFFVVGLPGLALAVIFRLTVREPQRGLADGTSPGEAHAQMPSLQKLREAARFMWQSGACRHVTIGLTLTAIAGYGGLMWIAPFLERSFAVPRAELGAILGPAAGLIGAVGTILGGYLADRLGRTNLGWKGWIVGYAKFVAAPLAICGYLQADLLTALLFYMPATFFGAFYHGPGIAIIQSVAPPSMRATVSSILIFIISLVGLGFGPLAVGMLSDFLEPLYGKESLRYALMSTALLNIWAGVHYLLAGTAFAREMKAPVLQ